MFYYIIISLGVFYGISRLINVLYHLGLTNVYLFDITFTSYVCELSPMILVLKLKYKL